VTRIVNALKQRRDARRWQRWSEVDPIDDLTRRARIGIVLPFVFFGALIALVVIGLVVAR
jgi:hypothetical protein